MPLSIVSTEPESSSANQLSVVSSKPVQKVTPADIEKVAKEYGVPADLAVGVAHIESAYDPLAKSNKGAQGIMQLMPDTAKRYGVTDSYDPEQNIRGGVQYLRDLLKQFNGDRDKALAAYNWGEKHVADGKEVPSSVQQYVKDVSGKAKEHAWANLKVVSTEPDTGAQGKQTAYTPEMRMQYAKPGPYVTKLSPQDEQEFQSWVKKNNVPLEDDGPKTGYDLRGFWKASKEGDPDAQTAMNPFDHRIHYSDKWKTPYSTEGFSRQSIYAKPNAPQWYGDDKVGWRLIDDKGNILDHQGDKDEGKFQAWMQKNGEGKKYDKKPTLSIVSTEPEPAQSMHGQEPAKPKVGDTGATISQQPKSGWLDRMRQAIANTAIGHSLQSEFPHAAEKLGLTPSETVQSPTYESHKEQFVAPEYLVSPQSHGHSANVIRGALQATGEFTSAPTLSMIVATAASAGLGEAAVPALGRMVSAGFTAQAAVNMIKEVPQLIDLYKEDPQAFEEEIGKLSVNAANAVVMGSHAAGKEIPVPGIKPEFRRAEEAQRREALWQSVPKPTSHPQQQSEKAKSGSQPAVATLSNNEWDMVGISLRDQRFRTGTSVNVSTESAKQILESAEKEGVPKATTDKLRAAIANAGEGGVTLHQEGADDVDLRHENLHGELRGKRGQLQSVQSEILSDPIGQKVVTRLRSRPTYQHADDAELAEEVAVYALSGTFDDYDLGITREEHAQLAKRLQGLLNVKNVHPSWMGLIGSPQEPVHAETPETIGKQIDALKAGTVSTVMIPQGGEVPAVPGGMQSVKVDAGKGAGTYIFNPSVVSAETIRQAAESGKHGELLGHVQSKAEVADKDKVVVQARAKDGTPVQESVVEDKPEVVAAQTKVLEDRHPDAEVTVTTPQEVLGERAGVPVEQREATGEGREPSEAEKPQEGAPASTEPASIIKVPLGSLVLDPNRFQYKLNVDEKGVSNILKGRKWNPDLAGVVSVWQDPRDEELYVVNGHHRVDLARENGVQNLDVRVINADNAKEARSIGALQNIAEGRGTAVDAAKFVRDTGRGEKDLENEGITLSESKAADGVALAKLSQPIFDEVAQGRMRVGRGVAIGNATDDPAQQEAILKMIEKREKSGKAIPDSVVAELGRMAKGAKDKTETQDTLFGVQSMTRNLLLEKAEVSDYIRKQIGSEKKLFTTVGTESTAQRLGKAGNVIDAGENAKIAQQAAQAQELYDRFSVKTGEINDILNRAADELSNGESPNAVKQRAYEETRAALSQTIGQGVEDRGEGVQTHPPTGEAEAHAEPAAGEREGAVVPAETKPPWEMSYEELEQAEKDDRGSDHRTLVGLFGSEEEAKTYERLQRTANGSDTAKADRASDILAIMERRLTPDQQDRLYGQGKYRTEYTYEDYREFRNAVGRIDGDNAKELGESMKWAITKVGDADFAHPETMKTEQQIAFAQLRRGFQIADENGWDKNEVLQAALKGSSERFADPEDAKFMLRRFMKQNASETPVNASETPVHAETPALPPAEPTLPGMESVPAERAEAAAGAQGERLTGEVAQPAGDISRATGEMERKSPLFRDSEASPQNEMFGGEQGPLFSGMPLPDMRLVRATFPDIAKKFDDWVSGEPNAGDTQAAVQRETRGDKDRAVAIVAKRLEKFQKEWRTRSREDFRKLAQAVEGTIHVDQLNPRDQELARFFKQGFDEIRSQIQALKPEALKQYVENYFPHIWENPARAEKAIKNILSGKRPFAGAERFRQHRTVPTIEQGIEMGLKPVSWNPVDMFLLKYNEEAQFLMAHKTLDMMKEAGTAKFVRPSEAPPQDWVKLDDRLGTVYGKENVQAVEPGQGELYDEHGRPRQFTVIRGHYWAPPEAAKVFNNYVSRGLAGRFRGYDILQAANSNINALQLGFSFFHFTTTAVNTAVSDIALGIQQMYEGKIAQGATRIAGGITTVPSVINTFRNGTKLMEEYLTPKSYEEFSREAQALSSAGGRVKQQTIQLQAFDQLMNAVKNRAGGDIAKSIVPAIIERSVYPVMEVWVPRMKFGAFYNMAHDILEQAHNENWAPEKTRARMQTAWDSIDNRFGQMVYDNLFWKKTVRDIVQLATRSVGWNFGTIREMGGAIFHDLPRETARLLSTQEAPQLTDRMAFTFGLAFYTGLVGAVMTRAMTGQWPQTWKDYYYPRQKDGTRMSIPGYMKDVVAYLHDPKQTLLNKMSPLVEMTSEAIQNRDFYGTEIRHKDDPAMKQLWQSSKFVVNTIMPFSMTGSKKLIQKTGENTDVEWKHPIQSVKNVGTAVVRHPGQVLAGQFGFQPAPAFIQHSPALNKAYDYEFSNRPSGTRTQTQFDHYQRYRAVEDMFRSGKVNPATIKQWVDEGKLTTHDVQNARKYAKIDPLVSAVASRDFTLEQMLRVYDVADDKEKALIRPIIRKHRKDITNETDPDAKKWLMDHYLEAVHPQGK